MIVASVLHKMKTSFFLLVQNEDGDLFKVSVDHEDEQVEALRIRYFDTVPVAATLCILRSGFLLVASETGAQQLYAFQKLGDDDDERFPEYISTDYGSSDAGPSPLPSLPTFCPRPLDNLALAYELDALDPLLDLSLIHI